MYTGIGGRPQCLPITIRPSHITVVPIPIDTIILERLDIYFMSIYLYIDNLRRTSKINHHNFYHWAYNTRSKLAIL